ncbi:MAG: selenium-dependent molybdenum cofactor biosynthesis protein YqeB [Treponemataceae bacterium]
MVVLIKGAGDLASGVAHRLFSCGFSIIMTEIKQPTTVRTSVSFSSAVLKDTIEIEGIKGQLTQTPKDAIEICQQKKIAVIVDEHALIAKEIKPDVIIDAIIAKKNIGTKKTDAKIVIALGPGFIAGKDCHAVIETNRGHYLGKVFYEGSAQKNTGIPGDISGFTTERIIRASKKGVFSPCVEISDYVRAGQIVAKINDVPVKANIDGIVRGILFPNTNVFAGMKCGDIDPRAKKEYCFSISDKARAIAGGVLEALLHLQKNDRD